VDVAAFLETCQNNNGGGSGATSENKNDSSSSSSVVDDFRQPTEDVLQIGNGYTINVDRVGSPSSDDLLDIPTTAVTAGLFDTLVAALTATELVGALSAPNGPYTVFAPTDKAFAALPEGLLSCLLQEENLLVLSNILLYHVASGQVLSTDLTNGMTIPTLLQGEEVSVEVSSNDDDGVVTVKINNATVSTSDVLASNGVIHSIDQVLVPSTMDIAAFLADTCNNGGSGNGSGSVSSTATKDTTTTTTTSFTSLAAVDEDVTNEEWGTAMEKTIRAVLGIPSSSRRHRHRHRFLAPRTINDDSDSGMLEVTTVVTTEPNCNTLLTQEATTTTAGSESEIDTTQQRCVRSVTTLTAPSPGGVNTMDVTVAQQTIEGAIQDGSFRQQLQEVTGLITTVLLPLSSSTEEDDTDAAVTDVADADADGGDTTVCKSIHEVLTEVGATEFSRLLQQREIDFKYGVFTVFAPPDNLILEAVENVNMTNLDDILYFHVAANVVEETLTDYCGTSLVMLNDMILDSRTQENSTTVCASEQVYQLGPGNRAPNIPPRVVGTANEACNGVVYKILHSLMLPTPLEVPVIIAPAPSSTNPIVVPPPTPMQPGEGSGTGTGGGVIPGVGPGDSNGDGGVGATTPTQLMRPPTLSPTTAALIETPTQMLAPTMNGTNQMDDTPTNATTTGTSAAPAFQLPSPPPAPTAPARQPTTTNSPPVPSTDASDPSSDAPPIPPFTLDEDGGDEQEPDSDSGSNYLSCWNNQCFVLIAVVSTTFLLHSCF